jgi:hypothetical protein
MLGYLPLWILWTPSFHSPAGPCTSPAPSNARSSAKHGTALVAQSRVNRGAPWASAGSLSNQSTKQWNGDSSNKFSSKKRKILKLSAVRNCDLIVWHYADWSKSYFLVWGLVGSKPSRSLAHAWSWLMALQKIRLSSVVTVCYSLQPLLMVSCFASIKVYHV